MSFNANANLLTLKSDLILPTGMNVMERRMDLVVLFAANHFFGENNRTLGYSTSYQGGIGAEFSVKSRGRQLGYVRFSGQLLRAENMEGWMLTLGFSPN